MRYWNAGEGQVPTSVSSRAWRRLERRALRGHQRDLDQQLRALAMARPLVLASTGRDSNAVLAFHISGWTLVIGGVAPSAARSLSRLTGPANDLTLLGGGRYGRYWWIKLGRDDHQVLLGSHLLLRKDPGPPTHPPSRLPVLSHAAGY